MPMAAMLLRPTVDLEKTPSLNEAGISQSQLIRFKGDLVETYGGWTQYLATLIPSTVKDLHAWQDVAGSQHLGIAATQNLMVATSGLVTDLTPQILTTNPSVSLSISSGSYAVSVFDPNSGPTVYNSVYFNTPVSIGNLFLNGAYQIASVLSTGSYTITSSVIAATTIVTSGVLPTFSVSSGSPTVTVSIPNNGFTATPGIQQQFIAPTTIGNLTISGPYNINSVLDSTNFTIVANTQASTTLVSTMNGGLAQYEYFITIGPAATGTGFGAGGFGSGGFGGGGGGFAGATGTPITATDWSQDNWGEILLACPTDGPIYTWSPQSGFSTAQVVATAPFFNGGIFISQPQQILVAWRSTQSSGVQDNLRVRWSNALDYTNWTISNATTAGSFHIPTGSLIMGGLQAPNYGVIWTDIDAWVMQYVGGTVVFNFTRVGSGCGLIGQHAAGVISGSVYWCGTNNFFTMGQSGVQVIPCSVWDYIFQNLNTAQVAKIRCATNTAFNEVSWFFPSSGSTENDSYVKLNINTGSWDYGRMPRTAWVDVSILGNPIGADTSGTIFQHEMGTVQSGVSSTSFQTGWFSITEGNDLAVVDYVLPDFIWGLFDGAKDASVNVTFYSADYPGDTPRQYGPYTVTSATEYITPRLRGRLMSISIQSNSQSFWRLGRVRYRYALAGRR
jgi:hypothetical protein